ncbi:MAG TPA: 30S ribosomal protein S18 [Patescibacteria group bacterium]|nr:30S ribosomal protein S18 [Patescibacteria group bacterium]
MIRRKRLSARRIKVSPKNCYFCQNKLAPDYKNPETLRNYLTERGKIVGKDRSGLCSKHQRHLAVAIKRARFLGLLPFVVRVK